MNDLLVMTFEDETSAKAARDAVRKLQHEGLLVLEDAAVLTADHNGKVSVHNELSRDVKIGAGVGAMIGLLFTFFFPFIGLAVGTAGGAIFGALLDRGVDKEFVNEVKKSLKPGTSALFLVIERADMNALRAALAPLHGTIYETTLDSEVADQLRGTTSR